MWYTAPVCFLFFLLLSLHPSFLFGVVVPPPPPLIALRFAPLFSVFFLCCLRNAYLLLLFDVSFSFFFLFSHTRASIARSIDFDRIQPSPTHTRIHFAVLLFVSFWLFFLFWACFMSVWADRFRPFFYIYIVSFGKTYEPKKKTKKKNIMVFVFFFVLKTHSHIH